MRSAIHLVLCLFFSITVYPQQNYKASNGQYEISHVGDNIIRLRFRPGAPWQNEQASDAVLMKTATQRPVTGVSVQGNKIVFRNKAILLNADTMSGYLGFRFSLATGEKIFGGGERALPLNRRGYRFDLYNNPWYGYQEGAANLNYSVPFFTSSKGYGLFFDNPSKGIADIGFSEDGVMKIGFTSGELNVYVILGNNYKEILQSFHRLTGKQPLPPRWAFGNLMSRFGYTSEKQADSILAKMTAEHIPVDAVIFDLFWFGDSIKGTLGNLDWINKQKWPDARRMIAEYKKQGVQTILVTEPFFVETSRNYAASKPYLAVDSAGKPFYLTDFYFGRGGLIDIFRRDARDWFWKFYKKQMELGVEAWWGDLGEPEKHPAALYHNLSSLGHRRLFAADEVHNIYGHYWTKMLFEKFAKDYPSKRLFSLNRSGFAGTQRFGIYPWTGDVSRSWSGLRAQLPLLLGMAMSGVPYVHSDAGGFAGGEDDYELYHRWLQFAAFTPIFRPHGTALYEVEPQAKSFPSEAALMPDPWKGFARESIYKRYSLLPYNYTLAYEQAVNGSPLMAPMYYHFPSDTNTIDLQNQFMWGEHILVAPVLEKGQQQARYYLPAGKWYDITQRKLVNGGGWQTQQVSLTDMPVLFREGCYVVMNENFRSNTSTYTGDSLGVFHVASRKPSVYRLYNDDGRTKQSIAAKQYEMIRFSSLGITGNILTLKIDSNNGRYPGKPKKRSMMFTVAMEKQPSKLVVNGKPAKRYRWDAASSCLFFNVDFTGKPVMIAMSW